MTFKLGRHPAALLKVGGTRLPNFTNISVRQGETNGRRQAAEISCWLHTYRYSHLSEIGVVLIDVQALRDDPAGVSRVGVGAEKDCGAFPSAGIHG